MGEMVLNAGKFVVGGLQNALSFMNLSWTTLTMLFAFVPSIIFTGFVTICIIAIARMVVNWL